METSAQSSTQTSRPRTGEIVIRPLGEVMGAEVIGADLSRPNSPEELARFDDALNRYKVLCFRDQHLSKDQLVAFSRQLGPLGEHIMPGAAADDYQEINVMSNKGPDGKPTGRHPDPTAKRWHTDRSYMPRPAKATLLYGVEVPTVGGDTLFADGAKAYEALAPELRAKVDRLNAIHNVEHTRRTGGVALATEYEKRRAPPVRHPLARPHPATGKKALYCGCHAWKVEGMSDEEGRALLDYLIDFAVQERFLYRHKWKARDVLMWDNRCVFHAATDFDTAKELRVMYRTIIEGEPTVPVAA
ncbi:MAG: TauD/TfdA family dioxygenase [Burkholderiales bacterium]